MYFLGNTVNLVIVFKVTAVTHAIHAIPPTPIPEYLIIKISKFFPFSLNLFDLIASPPHTTLSAIPRPPRNSAKVINQI